MNPQKGLWSAIAFATTIGATIAAALAIGIGLGLLLDRVLGTSPWFSLLGSILGLAAGATGAYRMVMREMDGS
jgi:ATP synthase protein I